ncbi:polyketide synthase [Massariosphaeria phaeospora]|uniref:Polyketide synthase n=1 Tax=Massariosphaeria phaeospora TaxID=100035 RepID=A0A7C8MG58_9PLEO|nr:polyketide synthase [Massariosphaeria phaeospora]
MPSRTPPSPIAIVGMGMRLPGGCHDSESFWDFLMGKKEGMIDIPSSRWNPDGFYDPHGRPGTVKNNRGNFLGSVDPAAFDAGFFSMSAAQVGKVDPQQRLLLEVVYESLENAGERNIRGKNIGVYVGTFAEDFAEMHAKDSQPHNFLNLTGHLDLFASNRVSHEFDWKGPSVTIKTGCSATMVCLDSACKALANGDCDAAVIGGTNLILSPAFSCALGAQGVNSADGRCRSFDSEAMGYGRAEAVSSLVVKRLDDALRDGNPIRAIIRSTLCNDDGRTPGITQPSSEAHEALIRGAYAAAGISEENYSQTGFFECHGTGTPVGDPIEVNAVARVFGRDGMIIGSVKSNVGHSESASGNTSIIKAILAMEHLTIPANIHFNTPNPKIPWKEAKLVVPTDAIAWPSDRLERASVNSFGIGGSNAHAKKTTVEEAPRLSLLLLSANNDLSLQGSIEKHAQYLQKHGPSRLRDMAYTLATRREHHDYRTFTVSDGEEPLVTLPSARTKKVSKSVVFVFTGQGAQWAEMGRKLIDDFPSVREDLENMDTALAECLTPPSWKIIDELCKAKFSSQISKAEFSQPLCTAIQVALVNLLRCWGVNPAAVVGHSSGEIAAAYATGGLSQKDAILSAYFRGLITKEKLADGAMAAVGLGADQVRPLLKPGVVVACENSPNSTTISGDRDALESLISTIQRDSPDVFVRALQVDNAYHSHHMYAFGEAYEQSIAEISTTGLPSIPFFSSVTGKIIDSPGKFTAAYWRSNLENPVLFHTAVRNIIKSDLKNPIFVEVGPHSALAGPLRQIFQSENSTLEYVSSLSRGKDDTESMYNAIGNLWRSNVPVNLDALNPEGTVLTDLPRYSWDHSVKYWEESRMCKEWRDRKFLPHETLGVRLPGSSHLVPTWRNVIKLNEVPWVRDHVVGTDIVFPAAGYICMAGEAVRQLTGRSDYSIRAITIRTAMIVSDSKPVDVVTTLKRAKLTDTTDSDWYDFRITSFNGSTWSEHVSGQVKSGPIRSVNKAPPQPDFLRKVSPSRWYQTMERIGFTYGPTFQGMRDISADPTGNEAVCTVDNEWNEKASFYELHPCTLDKLFQLMTVTQHQGNPAQFLQLSMPTYFGEIYISGGMKEMKVTASSYVDFMEAWSGDAFGTSDGKLVYDMKGCRVTPLGDSSEMDDKPKNAVQLAWKPDVSFLNSTEIEALIWTPLDIRQATVDIEKYFFLTAVDTIKAFASTDCKVPHAAKFHAWLNAYVEKVSKGDHIILPDGKELGALSETDRHSILRSLEQQFANSDWERIMQTAIRRVHENAVGLMQGTADTVEFLMEDNILGSIYSWFNLCWDYTPLLKLIGHSKPTLRVLEIGAGTGGTTTTMLEGLRSEFGERLYSKYSYTDISSGFFVGAKERFKDHQNIEYSVLDITKSPIEQGFEAASYDIILAANVLHATPSLQETLSNVRSLLHPQGRLILQELDMPAKWVNYIMAGFPGWWLGEQDGRPDEPYITREQWDVELKAAGFTGNDATKYETPPPYHITATIITSPAQPSPPKDKVTFLYKDKVTSTIELYQKAFDATGHAVELVAFGDAIPVGQDVVSLLELDEPFFHGISKKDFEHWIKTATNMGSEKWLWLTHLSSMGVKDPRYGMTLGFVRTLRSEKRCDFNTFEIDDTAGSSAPDKVLQLYEKLVQGPQDDTMDPEREYVLSEGTIHSSRYHWFSVKEQLEAAAEEVENKLLCIGQKGSINGLRWEKNDGVARPCKGDEIAIRPHTVGVNFRDILQTQGIIDGSDLGGECSAVVTEVGPDVTDFAVGDRVFVMVPYCFSDRVLVSQQLVAKIPDNITAEEAATMPITYVTVIYGLRHLRRLEKGDSILIHSAAGGVGISAIHLAQSVGAKVFATVGSEEKVKFLMDTFGLPREQIFDSHANSFAPDVLAATNGKGVDVALNSLAGELLHETWRCVKAFGSMIEIGKRDFYGHAKLDMMGFAENRSFIGIDARHMLSERPDLVGRLLRECAQLVSEGHIQPVRPIKTFEATEIADAFRYMQRGVHIGKITVRMPEPEGFKAFPCIAHHPKLPVQDDSSYLLVGGLGGIGRSIALSLALAGVKNLVFISRSGRTSKTEQFLQELEALGCSVQVVAGSVGDAEFVKSLPQQVEKPIRGVIHLAMTLADQSIESMTYDMWTKALEPKVDGTWNLHNTLENLDFFVMFSSVSGVMGQFGQANYAAANTFLDTFVQYRHNLGLPASVIDLGIMEDVGFVAESDNLLDYFKFLSADILTERDIFDIIRLAVVRSLPGPSTAGEGYSNASQFAPGVRSHLPLDDPNNRVIWKRDRRFAIARTIGVDSGSSSATTDSLKSFVSRIASSGATALEDAEAVEYLSNEIGKMLFGFLMRNADDMDIDEPLSTIGLDSLVGIELRNWAKHQLGYEISILEMMQSTLRDMGKGAVAAIVAKQK